MRKISILLLSVSSLLNPSALVFAQVIEEITVSAQRREQSLMEVPISITAFTAEAIERANMKGARDYLQLTPNVNFIENDSQGNKNGDVSIRGISDLTAGSNERGIQSRPAIGYYVDDFSVAHIASGSANPALDDVERVEVLRGPQGTYFGRNATGGAINIVTQKPNEQRSAKIKAGFGNFGTYEAGVVANIPIMDDLFVRGSASYYSSDGSVENLKGEANGADIENTNARIAVRWQPGQWTFDLTGQIIREDLGNAGKVPTGVLPSGFLFGPMRGRLSDFATCGLRADIFFPGNNDKNCNNGNNFSKIDNKLMQFNAQYEGERFTINTISGFLNGKLLQFEDIDDTGADVFNRDQTYKTKSFSQEIRLSSNDWELFNRPFNWTIGGIYYKDKERLRNAIISGEDVAPSFVGFLTVPGDRPNENNQYLERDGWAMLFDLSLDILDNVTLQAGGRYSEDNDEQSWTNTFASFDCGTRAVVDGVPAAFRPGCALGPNQSDNRIFSNGGLFVSGGRFAQTLQSAGTNDSTDFSPRIALTWAFTDNHHFYAVWSQGYRAAGVRVAPDSGLLTPAAQVAGAAPEGVETRSFYDKEKVNNYELGWKGSFNDRRTVVEAAIFWMEWDDMQVRVGRALCQLPDRSLVDQNSAAAQAAGTACTGNFPDNRVDNAESARSRGVELSVNSLVAENFQIEGAFGYMDAEFTDFRNSTSGDVSGQQLPSAPDLSLYLAGQYNFQAGPADAFIKLSGTHKSGYAINFGGVVGTTGGSDLWPLHAKDATLMDILAGLDWKNHNISLVVRNVTDSDYTTSTAGFSGLGQNILPHPRTIGVTWSMTTDF